ncbi:MAG: zinc ribbon domain-containing protein [Bacteroidota bacterium]
MPTYEYRREDGTTFDVFQRMSDEPLSVDPETGQKVTRVIGGGAGLIFKGDGFYLTDYARKGSNPRETSKTSDTATAASSDSGSGSGSKSETSSGGGSASASSGTEA